MENPKIPRTLQFLETDINEAQKLIQNLLYNLKETKDLLEDVSKLPAQNEGAAEWFRELQSSTDKLVAEIQAVIGTVKTYDWEIYQKHYHQLYNSLVEHRTTLEKYIQYTRNLLEKDSRLLPEERRKYKQTLEDLQKDLQETLDTLSEMESHYHTVERKVNQLPDDTSGGSEGSSPPLS